MNFLKMKPFYRNIFAKASEYTQNKKMAIGTYISIITLNVNGLNAPTKITVLSPLLFNIVLEVIATAIREKRK